MKWTDYCSEAAAPQDDGTVLGWWIVVAPSDVAWTLWVRPDIDPNRLLPALAEVGLMPTGLHYREVGDWPVAWEGGLNRDQRALVAKALQLAARP